MDNPILSMQSFGSRQVYVQVQRMQFKGKSIYNLLKMSWREDPSISVEPWQILDYEKLSEDELLSRLKELNIFLTKDTFLLYAENCDTPEELLECLWVYEEDLIGQDKAYLVLFELWKRWLPEKQTLSIFCDALDSLISLYDEGLLEDEEPLQMALTELEDILDQSVDQGAQPQEIFMAIMGYMAHDLEEFLYDYTLDLMDHNNELYASEIIDGISPYVLDGKWFDLLKLRFFSLTNSPETATFAARIFEEAKEEPDFSFLLELGKFLAHEEDLSMFVECVKEALSFIEEKEDLIEVLMLIEEAFVYLDQEEKIFEIDREKEKISSLSLLEGVKVVDKLLLEFK